MPMLRSKLLLLRMPNTRGVYSVAAGDFSAAAGIGLTNATLESLLAKVVK